MCDAVLTESEKILMKVYKLKSMAADSLSWKCDEVDFLVQMILHRPPQFKAARFFAVDRTTLFSILYSMTSFLLVMVQFKSN
jgi:hypothetical protein